MFEPNRQKTGGRKKGTPNKTTKAIKDMLQGALDEVGGQEYFVNLATTNPTAFVSLIAKLLPAEINASIDANVSLKDLPTSIDEFI